MTDRTEQFKQYDFCPLCRDDVEFLCTHYISNNQIYLYEQRCLTCHDIWQVCIDDNFLFSDTVTGDESAPQG